MATKLEKERKFLVKLPSSWASLAELFDDLIDVKRISQTYLSPEDGKQAGRIRKTEEGLLRETSVLYHYNIKEKVETGVHKETEREISKKEYESYLKKAHPNKFTVEKSRFVFEYNDQTFELDIFKGPLKGLAVLEIELEDINETVELPPFLKAIKEVTNDRRFSNFELASKKNNA